jgi:hypothetical protein
MTRLDYRSGFDEFVDRRTHPIHNWLGWAVYLGMSWTWCIGMFLPVLLVRDLGIWGWVIFAIPNVLGAAAMGWKLAPETSELIAARHRYAITCFALVTAAFQTFFAFWVFDRFAPPTAAWVVILAIVVFGVSRGRTRVAMIAAAAALLVSIFSMFVATKSGDLTLPGVTPAAERVVPTVSLVSLLPVCLFGFAMCPYLDPTFHFALQTSSNPRGSFGIAFGILFFGMIVFALGYAAPVAYMQTLPGPGHVMVRWLGYHWAGQLALTIAFQADADCAIAKDQSPRREWLLGAALIGGWLAWVAGRFISHESLGSGELIYRLFMAFYGLVFPAYVWLCMIPGRGRVPPDRKQILVLFVSILIAAPMFWLGFIERRMVWLLPGVGVVLLARLLIPRRLPTESRTAQAL